MGSPPFWRPTTWEHAVEKKAMTPKKTRTLLLPKTASTIHTLAAYSALPNPEVEVEEDEEEGRGEGGVVVVAVKAVVVPVAVGAVVVAIALVVVVLEEEEKEEEKETTDLPNKITLNTATRCR